LSTDERTYLVVVNQEEQYSIWQADQDVPAGWTAVGFAGPKDECLAHISTVWTDLRPLSLRQRLARELEEGVEVGGNS
jgi:MbtH protein